MTGGDGVRHPLTWVGAGMAAIAGLAHLGLLSYIFISRVAYPFDLEWMEGGMLCHALRMMEGQPLYAPPSADFISYLYTPLYPFVLAVVGKVVGLSYLLGRMVSVLSFVIALVVLFLAVRRESGPGRQGILWGVCAAGLIASSFQHTGAWYDLVRNDSLFLALIVGCLYLLRYHHRSWSLLITASILAGLGFLAKQTASMFIIMTGLALLLMSWRRLPVHIAVVGLVAGGSAILLNYLTDGWFWRYTFEMHQGHDLYWERIWPETEIKLLTYHPAVAGVIALWLCIFIGSWIWRRRMVDTDRSLLFWLLMAVTGVVVAAVGFATQWAVANAYIPGLVFPAVLAAMIGANLSRRWGGTGRGAVFSAVASLLVGGALAVQLICQLYDPAPHLPRTGDVEKGQRLVDLVRRVRGPVLMPYHPYYPVLAGKRPGYPQMGVNDVTRAGYPFPVDILDRVRSRFYGAIILDNPPHGRYDFINSGYKLGRYFRHTEVPLVVTGYMVRPKYLFVPKGPDPVPSGARRIFGFEDGTFAGWEITGHAFGRQPTNGPLGSQGPIGPYEGEFLANSYHGGDRSSGTLISPEFLVDLPWLGYRVGGGNRKDAIVVRLLVEGREVYRGTGPGSDIMTQVRVDLASHQGRRMRVELLDRADGPWGHLLFDDLILMER